MEVWELKYVTSRGVFTVYVTADTYANADEKAQMQLGNIVTVECLLSASRLAEFVGAFKGQDLANHRHAFHAIKYA